MLARLLLLPTQTRGAFIVPAEDLSTVLTDAPNGGWPGQTGAIEHDGVTFFGWVDGSGNIEAAHYDGSLSSIGTVHASLETDHHNSPSILRRASDGKLVTSYSPHDGAALYVAISTNADDATAWGAPVNIDASVGGSNYTYPNLFQTPDGTIWLFYRTHPSTTAILAYTTSTDGGATWAAQTTVYQFSGEDTYWRIDQQGTRFDFVVSDGTLDGDNASLYHFYRDGATYHRSDGTEITGPPFDPTDLTEVYDGSGGDGVRLPWDVVNDGGTITALFVTQPGGALNYRFARYDGSWNTELIVNAGSTAAFVEGGLVLDHADPDTVYLSRHNGSQWEIYRYTTADDGASWATEQITRSSSAPQFYPVPVRGVSTGFRTLWLRGTFTNQNTYSLGISGYDGG